MIGSEAARGELSRRALPEEALFEERLRPRTLAEMIGQDRLRENLAVFIRAARARGESLDHILFHGPPGLGKTSLAMIVAVYRALGHVLTKHGHEGVLVGDEGG